MAELKGMCANCAMCACIGGLAELEFREA